MTFLYQIQKLLERTYAPIGVNLENYLIGSGRCHALSRLAGPLAQDLNFEGRTFFRILGGKLYVAIYYHPSIITVLERHHPFTELSGANIHPLIVFLEELNHATHAVLQFLENRLQLDSEDLVCDLELQAKVDTYLALKLIVGALQKRRTLTQRQQKWLQYYLFEQESFAYKEQVLRDRYREANELGLSLILYLDLLGTEERIKFVRAFRELTFSQKRSCIQTLCQKRFS